MNYNIAVCDDDARSAEYVSALACEWAEARGNRAVVGTFASAEEFIVADTGEKPFDILLLDIEMGATDGVTLARTVRKRDNEVQIVFITGYSEYIAEGYDVDAVNYLMKPLKSDKLFATLDRAAERIRKNERALLVETDGETIRVPLYEIRYLEVRQNYVTVAANEEYEVRKPLADIEKKLDENFSRAGRSVIVNLRYIRKITRTDVHLIDGSALPLSRRFYEPLNSAFIKYV